MAGTHDVSKFLFLIIEPCYISFFRHEYPNVCTMCTKRTMYLIPTADYVDIRKIVACNITRDTVATHTVDMVQLHVGTIRFIFYKYH